MQIFLNNGKMIFALLLLVINEAYVSEKKRTSLEALKCRRYKESVFNQKVTFQPLVYKPNLIAVEEDSCKSYAPFIVNGTPAIGKEFPHMARLGYAEKNKPTSWFCGGTLVSKKMVLTAAHCFEFDYGDVNRVRLGELDFDKTNDDAQPEDFKVARYIAHPDYDEDSAFNDIGLVELAKSVIFSEYKLPACLPITSGDKYSNFIAVGWGSIAFATLGPGYLLKVGLERFPSNACDIGARDSDIDRLKDGFHSDSQICAGSKVNKDTCQGDSGGPLLSYHPKYGCMYYVVGITSSGFGSCGVPGLPAAYTKVRYYIDWIKRNIWK
ncbi:venom protease-like [Teleopsis dalmanni]|uniref:venom protease-like n=1 Tax=Teleopsis dalmanni TaxID=139649 RepID=UPI0018CCDD51|nr:venom protease-like [Teleopsis dalmanni]